MDFTSHSSQPSVEGAHIPGQNTVNNSPHNTARGRGKKLGDANKWLRAGYIVLLFSITIMLIAIALSFYSNNESEDKYVNSSAYQAVDVSVGGSSGDQIYFGNIKVLNNKYVVMDNVYYIPSSASASNVSLQPLVCQVDKPFNQIIVNRASINWWENLQSSGQVSKAIAAYVKAHPNGPSCPTSSPTTSSSSTTPSSTSPAPATTTTPTSTTKR